LEFLTHILPNGLEIVAECNDAAYSTALGFFVKTGSRDETDAVAGVSHFLEHMVFKGTPSRTVDDVNREFDEMGAHYNAATGEEGTVFYAAVLPEYQERAVRLLADILRPSLRREDFDTEKQVIIEEIRMYEDMPPFGADEKCRAAYFGPHPLGQSVLGSTRSITELDIEAMREYFGRRYGPGNIVLAGTGKIAFDALVATADECCGHWEPGDAGRKAEPATPRHEFRVIQKQAATQQYAVQMAAGPAADADDRYTAKLLATVLGDELGSRLFWELVDPGRAEHASLSHGEYEGAGAMVTYLSCDPDTAADNLRRILDVYRRAESDGVTPAELEQAKSKVRSRIVISSERPRGRLFAVGSDWVQRQEYRSVRDDLDAIAAITLEEMAAVATAYPLSRSTTVTIGPLADVAAPN
jgi:predicted Zn-dependent peptidase